MPYKSAKRRPLAYSPCFGCHRMFAYNPVRVPSIRPAPDMDAEPICMACIERVNPVRIAMGLEKIEPLPGAYGAP
jgi:hypothetical protein